jgi:MarR family transcriptional regulator, organic hydroperoxide resistance regulator
MSAEPGRQRIVSEILKLLPELGKALNDSMPEHAKGGPATYAQMKVLVHLAEYGAQTMGELAQGLRVTTPSATGLVNPLAAIGMVVRERDTQDRRVVRVRLSAKAEVIAREVLAKRRHDIEAALEGMDAEAQLHFLEGLTRLAAVYDKERETPMLS